MQISPLPEPEEKGKRFVLEIPPLEPFDLVAILLLPYPCDPAHKHLFPERGPESQADFLAAYRASIRDLGPSITPLLEQAGFNFGGTLDDRAVEAVLRRFTKWWHEDLGRALSIEETATPRFAELARALGLFRRAGRLPRLMPGNYVAQLFKHARSKGRESELRDAVGHESCCDPDEIIAGIDLADAPDAAHLKWDEAGNCWLVPDIPNVFDALVRGSRKVHRTVEVRPDSETIEKDFPGDDPDPAEASAVAEMVREIAEYCRRQGGAHPAAVEYLQDHDAAREDVARRHGVTVAAIRRAEADIQQRFGKWREPA